MHKLLLACYFVCAFSLVNAQEVVATQGDTYSNATGTIDFTIGEMVINTVTNGTSELTQGFHQTNWKFTGLEDLAPDVEIVVFPNPASDLLNIQTTAFDQLTYALYDEAGRIVAQDRLLSESTSVQVSQLAAGNYSLVLSRQEQRLKTFKLIKTL